MSEKWQDRLNRLAGEEVNKGEEFAESFARRDTGNDYSVDFERRRFRAVTKTDRSVETLSGGARQGGKSDFMLSTLKEITHKATQNYISIEDLIDNVNAASFYEWFKIFRRQYKNAPTLISDQETEGSD